MSFAALLESYIGKLLKDRTIAFKKVLRFPNGNIRVQDTRKSGILIYLQLDEETCQPKQILIIKFHGNPKKKAVYLENIDTFPCETATPESQDKVLEIFKEACKIRSRQELKEMEK